jgi:hypothetical protein
MPCPSFHRLWVWNSSGRSGLLEESKSSRPNMSKKEIKRSLKLNKDIRILLADKGKLHCGIG